jgi:hypothetical protein
MLKTPNMVVYSSCTPIELVSTDQNGAPSGVTAASNGSITVTSGVGGTLYTDPGCTASPGPTVNLNYAPGEHTKLVYFSATSPGPSTLTSTGAGGGWTNINFSNVINGI